MHIGEREYERNIFIANHSNSTQEDEKQGRTNKQKHAALAVRAKKTQELIDAGVSKSPKISRILKPMPMTARLITKRQKPWLQTNRQPRAFHDNCAPFQSVKPASLAASGT